MVSISKSSDCFLPKEEVTKYEAKILQLEEEAVKKDKQISWLTSRMREYEMGEYGLAEAVAEIKECRRIIRMRDKELENLTDEINTSRLQIAEIQGSTKSHHSTSQAGTSPVSSIKDEHLLICKKKRANQNNKIISQFSSHDFENNYSTQFQNEKLRLELSTVCQKAVELSVHFQCLNKQDQVRQETLISHLEEKLQKLNNGLNKRCETYPLNQLTSDLYTQSAGNHNGIIQGVVEENGDQNFIRQISVLKSNQVVLIRRYMILSERESALHRENRKLRKLIHSNWKKGSDFHNIIGHEMRKELALSYLDTDESKFLKNFKETSQNKCKDTTCQVNTTKLINIATKLLSETSLIKDLLEVSHYQTQAVEAMWFAQEVEMKALREQLTLLQAQSDEKMLLGKLAMKVLQLQFNQAACLYELKKYKLNQESLQDWHLLLKEESEENGKKFLSLYIEALNNAQHLQSILKDLCQHCNKALSSYLKANKSI